MLAVNISRSHKSKLFEFIKANPKLVEVRICKNHLFKRIQFMNGFKICISTSWKEVCFVTFSDQQKWKIYKIRCIKRACDIEKNDVISWGTRPQNKIHIHKNYISKTNSSCTDNWVFARNCFRYVVNSFHIFFFILSIQFYN